MLGIRAAWFGRAESAVSTRRVADSKSRSKSSGKVSAVATVATAAGTSESEHVTLDDLKLS